MTERKGGWRRLAAILWAVFLIALIMGPGAGWRRAALERTGAQGYHWGHAGSRVRAGGFVDAPGHAPPRLGSPHRKPV